MKRIPMKSFQSVWTERESSLLRRCCVLWEFGSNQEIIDIFGEEPRLLKTLEKDTTTNYEEGLKEIYKKLRPGEPPTVDSAQSLFNSMFLRSKAV